MIINLSHLKDNNWTQWLFLFKKKIKKMMKNQYFLQIKINSQPKWKNYHLILI